MGCKEGMARVFAVRVLSWLSITRLGASLIGAGKLSWYSMFVKGTGAVSRYKFDRSQKSVTVQDLNCAQMRVSGCNGYYKFVLCAGAKVEERSDETPPWRGKNRDKQLHPYCPC